jgi:hypothetical protein
MKAFLLIFNFEISNFKIYGIKQSQNAFRLPVSTPQEALDILAWCGLFIVDKVLGDTRSGINRAILVFFTNY